MDRFADCLTKGRLRKIEVDPEKVAAELRSAVSELERGRARYRTGTWDEATTQSYFALYRASRAALLSQGYMDTNSYGLCTGLERFFVEPDQLPRDITHQIREAKAIKDAVYAGRRSSGAEAQQVLGWAISAVRRILTLLAVPDLDPEQIDPDLPQPPNRPHRGHPHEDGSSER